MKIVSLASGSKGNAYCVCSGDAILLIDCGLCLKNLKLKCAEAGLSPDRICALVVTHSHDDHVKGIPLFHKNFPEVPLFANLMTAESIAWRCKMAEEDFTPFENGQTFTAGPFEISPFSIPHDTADPVGYLVRAEGMTYFHGTDIGTPLDSVGLHLAEADVATLESNHDPAMLSASVRPEELKRRIWGPRGHLSNDQACELVRKFASPRLKRLNLAHLSEECNAPHLAETAMRETLAALHRADIDLEILAQNLISTCSFPTSVNMV